MLRLAATVVITGLWTMVSCTDHPPSPVSLTSPGMPSGNRPPTVTSAKFLKDPLSSAEEAAVQVVAEDPEHEAVTLSYQWYVEDVPLVGETKPTLSPAKFRRGQRVSVEITPADAKQKGPVYRVPAAVVGNTPPVVRSAMIVYRDESSGNVIEALVDASDPDLDPLSMTYHWYKNDVLVKEGEEAFLDAGGVAVGETVVVEVTARDPSGTSHTLRSAPWSMGNRPPRIVSTPPIPHTSESYTYRVQAIDDDGDDLVYMLETAPTGMTISERTGRIDWRVPQDQAGVQHVTIVVKDGRGGAALQEFDLHVTPLPPVSQPGT
ncbi:MAG: putative Ig domain-containing protein [Nitrospira sp.]|nr:putative Ig domain-containing protein [Nitrospira sp.]MCP9441889.1 putative Ig domain-containing protein [Nitrospira sp.]